MIGPALTASTRGAAAEQYVIAQALRHGFRVAVPAVDLDGVDLFIFNSRNEMSTVQVKTALFKSSTRWRLKITTDGTVTGHRYTVDAFVAVAPDFTKLWVVPSAAVAHLLTHATLRDEWLDRWDVFQAVGAYWRRS